MKAQMGHVGFSSEVLGLLASSSGFAFEESSWGAVICRIYLADAKCRRRYMSSGSETDGAVAYPAHITPALAPGSL